MTPLRIHRTEFRSVLYYAMVTVVSIIFIGYVLFQARFLLAGPQIELAGEPAIVQKERVIELGGLTRNIVKLTLNGREIYTDKQGKFKEALVLENGYTVATLQARDRYGRVTTLTRQYVYTPAIARSE